MISLSGNNGGKSPNLYLATTQLIRMQDYEPISLDEIAFQNGKPRSDLIYYKGTLMWKDSVAFLKKDGESWKAVASTGQWTILGGYALFLRGGVIREMS